MSLFLKRYYFVFLLFIIIGLVVYSNSLNNPFQHDDENTVQNNVSIRQIGNITEFFKEPDLLTAVPLSLSGKKGGGHYRPLVVVSYAINYAIGGLNPSGYHLVNLLFHAGASFLIFLIVKAMIGSAVFFAPLTAGLIFLVHPFNSEAVNYVTARSSVMSGFFYLLAFWCWVKYREVRKAESGKRNVQGWSYYITSLVAFAAGMLSKEVVITLPVMIWLYDVYGFKYINTTEGSGKEKAVKRVFNRREYLCYLPFLLLVVIPYMFYRKVSFNGALPVFQRDLWPQLFTELPVLIEHWRMFLWPSGFSIVHDVNIYTELTGWVFFSGVLLIFYLSLVYYFLRLRKTILCIISFFMSWFIIVLLPTTVIPLNAIFQENRGYLAIVSFSVIAGIAWSAIAENKRFRILTRAGLCCVLLLYVVLTINRNTVWGDSTRIWSDAVKKAPNNVMAYAGLSGAYRDRGDIYLSIEMARKGIEVNPNYFYLHTNLGRGYQLIGDIDNAIEEYEKALSIDPHKAVIWNDLAVMYVQKGDIKRAERHITRAISVWGDLPHLHYNLAVIMAGQGKLHDAEVELRKAVSMSPSYFQARYELGETLERLGRAGEAKEQYEYIIRYSSEGPDPLSSIIGQDKKFVDQIVQKARQRLDGNIKLE